MTLPSYGQIATMGHRRYQFALARQGRVVHRVECEEGIPTSGAALCGFRSLYPWRLYDTRRDDWQDYCSRCMDRAIMCGI